MYDLPYHKEHDEQIIKQFLDAHPFAFLTGCDSQGKPVATQIPMLLEERDGRKLLIGHMMKATDHYKALSQNANVLVVFTGRHSYVSGAWYDNPHIPSTWNYMSVHARGAIRFLDEAGLIEVLRKTSLHFEGNDQRSPTIFDNIPAELTRRLINAVIAFEIEVMKLDTVFKLSQDRDARSYSNIIDKLEQQGDDGRQIAAEMEKRTKLVFPQDS